VGTVRHERGVGRRLHEESIRLQQRLASVPLPLEEPKSHRLLHAMGAVLAAVVLIALALVLFPAGSSI
jgi:hypothetical protein